MDRESSLTSRPVIPRETVTLIAEAVLALRATSELAVSWDIARQHLGEALGAAYARLLRVDRRSGALFLLEDPGVETPYLAEHGGPVEWVMRNDRARFDEVFAEDMARETLLWHEPPVSLATVPLVAGSTAFGFLLVGFSTPHVFNATERLLVHTMAPQVQATFLPAIMAALAPAGDARPTTTPSPERAGPRAG